jgi:hypothetical protein
VTTDSSSGCGHPPAAVGTAWATFTLAVLLGAATFTAIGVAYTRLVASADSAPALANAAYLPLLFLLGAWFPISGLPYWLASLADAFPLAPMLDGMRPPAPPRHPARRAAHRQGGALLPAHEDGPLADQRGSPPAPASFGEAWHRT